MIVKFSLVAALVALAAPTPALAGGAIAAAAKAPPVKLSDSKTLQAKHGYWVECDAVGENCYYVDSFNQTLANGDPAPGAFIRRVKATAPVEKKDGYWNKCDSAGVGCVNLYTTVVTGRIER